MHISCPTCSQSMECPDDAAGKKTICPKCGQKILIPAPLKPTSTNKTTLAKLENDVPNAPLTVVPIPTTQSPTNEKKASLDDVYVTRCYTCGRVIPISQTYRWFYSFSNDFHFLVDYCQECFYFYISLQLGAVALVLVPLVFLGLFGCVIWVSLIASP